MDESLKYTIYIQYDEIKQHFIASAPQLEGISVHGNTQIQALHNCQEAIKLFIENFPEKLP